MWLSFLDSTFDRAIWWNDFANIIFVLSLIVGVVAMLVIIRTSSSKEEFLKRDLAETNARAEEAKAEAAKANLDLAKFKAPRMLTPEQQARIASKIKPFAGTVFDAGIGPKGDPEPLYILRSIHSTLSLAGWSPIDWTGGGETYTESGMPSIGLTMVTNVIIDVSPSHWKKLGPAATALAEALAAEGIAAIADSKPTSINSDAIHIRIGRKL